MGNNLSPHLESAQKTGVCSLCGKGLSEIPPQLLSIGSSLRTLDLSNNKLKTLPVSFGRFTALKSLTLTSNRLEFVPVELGQLKKLEVLMLNKNLLKNLPLNTFSNLSHLKTLSLASNQLTAFPENLNALRQLDVLDLSDNKIRVIPESIHELQAMELNLNTNQIALLPENLAQCPRLKVLRLEENCLPLDAITSSFLKNSHASLLALDGNLFAMREFQEKDGYDQYMTRFTATKKKFTG